MLPSQNKASLIAAIRPGFLAWSGELRTRIFCWRDGHTPSIFWPPTTPWTAGALRNSVLGYFIVSFLQIRAGSCTADQWMAFLPARGDFDVSILLQDAGKAYCSSNKSRDSQEQARRFDLKGPNLSLLGYERSSPEHARTLPCM